LFTAKVDAETRVLLKHSGFDPELALRFIERGDERLPFVLQEENGSVNSVFKHYENIHASLADATSIRLAKISDSPSLLTTDSYFHIYRRHGSQTIP
jgi:predicted nucleic acid-binding protein